MTVKITRGPLLDIMRWNLTNFFSHGRKRSQMQPSPLQFTCADYFHSLHDFIQFITCLVSPDCWHEFLKWKINCDLSQMSEKRHHGYSFIETRWRASRFKFTDCCLENDLLPSRRHFYRRSPQGWPNYLIEFFQIKQNHLGSKPLLSLVLGTDI